MTDDVATALDDIRKRYEVFGEAESLPRLLAAVDAALALAGRWRATAVDLDARANRTNGIRGVHLFTRAQALDDAQAELGAAIVEALAGEGNDGG